MDYNSEESTVLGIDMDTVEERKSFSPLPDGDYRLNIVKAAIKPTKKCQACGKPVGGCCNVALPGKRVALELSVDEDGEYQGRRVFCDFNIFNASEQAQHIGRSELKGLLIAVGKLGEQDMAKLVGDQVVGTIRTQKGSGGYEDKNVVKKFAAVGGAKSAPPSAAPKTPATKAPPAFMAKPQLAK